ncbi:unnamed protein product [Darwinula stevensoni]|uniref:Mesoderm induction early response protein 1 n=1 Tax=Darwinula stevensoni TaxID=69355 RepID=A0A7R9A5R8_9CRUS|nr:unnamed protein product [Darwinula stevensoni]CAG0885827.1 unnamed protein product [Darwinula stevensoni]
MKKSKRGRNSIMGEHSRQTQAMIGPDYQAEIPIGSSSYEEVPSYENEDALMWDPSALAERDVEDYLQQVASSSLTSPTPDIVSYPVPDNEEALYQLLKCGHNTEEALRRRRINPYPRASPLSLWAKEECEAFECGLRMFGKKFYLIQQYKVRTRSIGELINFYYLWKT